MKTVRTLLATCFLCFAVTSTFSQTMTAGELQEICIAPDPGSKMACKFYILGITQGIDLGIGIAAGKVNGKPPCVPENTSSTALELAVKIKMGQNLMVFPDDRKLDASGLVAAILIKTFPCRK